jgi:uncharacterized protein (TIGR02996 family)
MASVMAIVSRKVFERDFRVGGKVAVVGEVVPTTTYASSQRTLDRLADGGDLFLITVTPAEELLLVGVLADPTFAKDRWTAAANVTPVTDISGLVGKLELENGKGITARPGALAMSLQTPRVLADQDVVLLRGGASPRAKPAPASKAKSLPPPKPAPKVSSSASPLQRAKDHLESGRLGAALDDLLTAWAGHKAPELAALVDTLGAHIARALPAIDAKPRALDAPWREIADRHRAIDVPRLIAAFEPATGKQIAGWLEVLERFPPDPRIAAAALGVVPNFVASSAGPTRTRAFRLVERIADPSCLSLIDKTTQRCRPAWNAKDLAERLRKIAGKLPPVPALAASDKPLVGAMEKTIAKLAKGPAPEPSQLETEQRSSGGDGTAAGLLREVYDDPASDAPRLVYADYLQQENDPRGELIALQLQPQLTRTQEQRVKALLRDKRNLARWLGPLVAVVHDPVFARGFLQACTVKLANAKHHELLADPAWATVETIRTSEAAVAAGPTMRSLRHVIAMPLEELAKLVDHPKPLAIETISGMPFTSYAGREADRLGDDNRAAWAKVATLGALRSLRDVEMSPSFDLEAELVTPAGLGWLLPAKLGKQLRSLTLVFESRMPRVNDWLPLFRSHSALERIELRRGHAEKSGFKLHLAVTIERAKSHLAIRVACTSANYWNPKPEALFAEFPDAAVPTLAIRYCGTKPDKLPELRAYVAGLAKRFEQVDVA